MLKKLISVLHQCMNVFYDVRILSIGDLWKTLSMHRVIYSEMDTRPTTHSNFKIQDGVWYFCIIHGGNLCTMTII
jgi:hypothetical protein